MVWCFDGNEVVGVRRWLVLVIMLFGFAFALCLYGVYLCSLLLFGFGLFVCGFAICSVFCLICGVIWFSCLMFGY